MSRYNRRRLVRVVASRAPYSHAGAPYNSDGLYRVYSVMSRRPPQLALGRRPDIVLLHYSNGRGDFKASQALPKDTKTTAHLGRRTYTTAR